ncbi:hypothetical protein [Flavobacterium sp. JP2137]|uniref:hypothetical protein n=1 Tax=Flavobacterium sp. JP2137 TaxID=3414510 RepID=UPI003D300522
MDILTKKKKDTTRLLSVILLLVALFYSPEFRATPPPYKVVFAFNTGMPQLEILHKRIDAFSHSNILTPGQVVDLNATLTNRGAEPLVDAKIEIPIPANMHYVAGSLAPPSSGQVYWSHPASDDPNATPGGKIIWDLTAVEIPSGDVLYANLNYRLRVTTACVLLLGESGSCSLDATVDGTYSARGKNTLEAIAGKFVKGYETTGGLRPIYGGFDLKIVPPLAFLTSCSAVFQNSPMVFNYFCGTASRPIPRNDITSKYPAGTQFYKGHIDGLILASNLITGDFDVAAGTNIFYAVVYGMDPHCFLTILVKIQPIYSKPTVKNGLRCVGTTGELEVERSAEGIRDQLELVYFANATTTTALSAPPQPTAVGVYTYYVAEGKSQDGVWCFGPRVAFTLTVVRPPTGTWSQLNYEICDEESQKMVIQTTAAVRWQIKTTDTWQPLTAENWPGYLLIAANEIVFGLGNAAVDLVKIRVVMTNQAGCEQTSEEVTVRFRPCRLPTNPMLPSQFSKRI